MIYREEGIIEEVAEIREDVKEFVNDIKRDIKIRKKINKMVDGLLYIFARVMTFLFGVNKQYKIFNNESLLIIAAKYNGLNTLDWLLKKGANINLKDDMDKSAIDYAVERGHVCISAKLYGKRLMEETKNIAGRFVKRLFGNGIEQETKNPQRQNNIPREPVRDRLKSYDQKSGIKF